ncbi:trypsin-like peptidase domain-containing protein [Streptomyces sp. NPDC018031]|uniref:S1C family serine protease n=1 Tax=Streptomyces sp. NPDC018031 TaxID=3365033 RepID=UPI0037A14A13
MSTENQGPAVPPTPESHTAPPAPHPEPTADAGTTPPAPAAPPAAPADGQPAPADRRPSPAPAQDPPGADYDLAAPARPQAAPDSPPPGTTRPAPEPALAEAPAPAPVEAPASAPAEAPAPADRPTAGHTSPPPAPQPTPAHSAAPAGPGAWWAADGGAPPATAGHPAGGGGGGWGTAPLPVPGAEPSGRKRSGGIVAAVLAAVLVAGGIGGGIGYWAADRESGTDSTTLSAPGDPKAGSRAPGSVSDIASKALPSVVTIEAQSTSGEGGTGTGFVYDKQGHILTNNHVVASAADSGELAVTFSDGKRYDAEVVGRAEGYDVAVLKLKNAPGARLTPLPLGNSDNVTVGDATVAIGAPFGLSGTVTTGIVSAKNRPVASTDGGGSNSSYMSALQTDASINPGNSGGPLLDAKGAVIGVNSAIQSAGNGGGFGGEAQQSGSIGLGFAIPINQAKNVAEQLIKTGEPVYPVIEATVTMKDTGTGATIAPSGADGTEAVIPGGPADQAGLKSGDVITKLDDTVIDSGPTLISEIWTHQPGDKVTLTYERNGKESTVQLTLGERKGDS